MARTDVTVAFSAEEGRAVTEGLKHADAVPTRFRDQRAGVLGKIQAATFNPEATIVLSAEEANALTEGLQFADATPLPLRDSRRSAFRKVRAAQGPHPAQLPAGED